MPPIGSGAYEAKEARASSEFRTRRHAMEPAFPEFLPSYAVRPQVLPGPKKLEVALVQCWICHIFPGGSN